ncbi:MAG: ABC transporter permease [Bacteroidales bacterium]|nr:ABC transporter permease [Bacteroidales bacterium]
MNIFSIVNNGEKTEKAVHLNIVERILHDIGDYLLLMKRVFSKPENGPYFRKQLVDEINGLCIDSLLIVSIISIFMGAVITIQTNLQIENPLLPTWTIGFVVRQSIVLEFAPTIISVFLAGKIGSRIASEIGTMKVTEQVDALETMGINSASHLILPKIVACTFINPLLIIIGIFLGLLGGWGACEFLGTIPSSQYIEGIRSWFLARDIYYAIFKTLTFAFVIASVSGYWGYITKGGALEVGKTSTKAVVNSSFMILLLDLLLTELFLG